MVSKGRRQTPGLTPTGPPNSTASSRRKFSVAEGPVAGPEVGDPYHPPPTQDEDIVTYTLEGDDSAVLSVVVRPPGRLRWP